MSSIDNDEILPVQDELASLKARADLLGLSYHPTIGVEKLREKVNAAATASTPEPVVATVPENLNPAVETESERRYRKKREANELVRVRVTCMNPAKSEWEGEIFTAGNSLVGSFTKFVPFNSDDGWHIPRIIYNQMIDRKCQIFVTTRDARGNSTRTGKLIKEFAIEVLPQLTVEELHDLAQRQAMAKTID
jgi:hypothetical protein